MYPTLTEACWHAPAKNVVRHTVLIPDTVLAQSVAVGRPLTVVMPAPVGARLEVTPAWRADRRRAFALPRLAAVQIHFLPGDLSDPDPPCPPWPVEPGDPICTNPNGTDPDGTDLVRAAWLAVQVAAEALALESIKAAEHRPGFLAHYVPTAAARTRLARADLVWLIFCAGPAVVAAGSAAFPAVAPSLAEVLTTDKTVRLIDVSILPRTGELWVQAGLWMARQLSARTRRASLDALTPTGWAADMGAQLDAGLCPGEVVSDAAAVRDIWPVALAAGRRRVAQKILLRALDPGAWPAELCRALRLLAPDLPPPLPLRSLDWPAFALACPARSGTALAFPAELRAALVRREEQRAARLAREWSAPLAEDRADRYAGIRQRLTGGLDDLLSGPTGPPCLHRALVTAREKHRVPYSDRLTLTGWLVAMEPAGDAAPLDSAEDVARWVLGLDLAGSVPSGSGRPDTEAAARVAELAVTVRSTRQKRQAGDLPLAGCHAVIERRAHTETIIRCHYATSPQTPVYDCQTQCSAGKRGLCITPLDHLLSNLDW